MVSDISSSRLVPAATVADAVAGDAMAFARIVRAHHDDMAADPAHRRSSFSTAASAMSTQPAGTTATAT